MKPTSFCCPDEQPPQCRVCRLRALGSGFGVEASGFRGKRVGAFLRDAVGNRFEAGKVSRRQASRYSAVRLYGSGFAMFSSRFIEATFLSFLVRRWGAA